MDRRILFAEFMGWEQITDLDATTYPNYWIMPDGRKTVEPPDCENNDTDCMALANALRNDGWIVHITFGHGAYTPYDAVVVENHPERMDYRQSWSGDDYKQGVCDLAEEIIRDHTS